MLSFMPSDLAFVFQSIMYMDRHICKQRTHGRIAKIFCLFAKDVVEGGGHLLYPPCIAKHSIGYMTHLVCEYVTDMT